MGQNFENNQSNNATQAKLQKVIATGTYAAKQVHSPVKIFAISHRLRFQFALKLIAHYKPKSLLDYGCGDATFLAMARDLVPHKIGVDMDKNHLKNIAERFQGLDDYKFYHVETVKELGEQFDIVTCMEVMEHCPPDYLKIVIQNIKSLVSPDGRVIISVPIEIGFVLVVKQFFRRLAGLRGMEHYKSTEGHNFSDFMKMLFANENTQIERHYYHLGVGDDRFLTCGHRGFNWKYLRKQLSEHFIVEETKFSPFGFFASLWNAQAWFILKLKK